MRFSISIFIALLIHIGSMGAMYALSGHNPPKVGAPQRLVTHARIISVSSRGPRTNTPAPKPAKPKAKPKPKLVKSDKAIPTLVASETPLETNSEVEESTEEASPASGGEGEASEGDIPVVGEGLANYRHNPHPPYPSQSRRMREEGKVLLKVLVSAEGKVVKCEVMRSSGFERLDLSALEAVRSWLFAPEERLGKPVQSWVLIPVVFHLNS